MRGGLTFQIGMGEDGFEPPPSAPVGIGGGICLHTEWSRADRSATLLTNRVVAAGVVVRCVLLARDELLRVVQVAVRARADFVDARGL